MKNKVSERKKQHIKKVRSVISRLHTGQSVYLAPDNCLDKPRETIVLKRAKILEIPAAGIEILIEMENGEKRELEVDMSGMDGLYLGTLENGRHSGYWVFLTEENFWDWRDWYILTYRLERLISFDHCDIDSVPNQKNLKICRILHDLLITGNLAYQNLSCEGCGHQKAGGQDAACAGCVRNQALRDQHTARIVRETPLK